MRWYQRSRRLDWLLWFWPVLARRVRVWLFMNSDLDA